MVSCPLHVKTLDILKLMGWGRVNVFATLEEIILLAQDAFHGCFIQLHYRARHEDCIFPQEMKFSKYGKIHLEPGTGKLSLPAIYLPYWNTTTKLHIRTWASRERKNRGTFHIFSTFQNWQTRWRICTSWERKFFFPLVHWNANTQIQINEDPGNGKLALLSSHLVGLYWHTSIQFAYIDIQEMKNPHYLLYLDVRANIRPKWNEFLSKYLVHWNNNTQFKNINIKAKKPHITF